MTAKHEDEKHPHKSKASKWGFAFSVGDKVKIASEDHPHYGHLHDKKGTIVEVGKGDSPNYGVAIEGEEGAVGCIPEVILQPVK